ncbi:MAG: hypothetical protein EOT04_01290 [Candidatus Chaera renei]|uniref:Prepilin-type N-terminal cleavage/methylation domain-containing protein n=1 Tax=Candidatus Chaera renei TaxID=2506947 RepID=A0A4Q0AJ71_9BACT|nr:MAG: hypothetical protein EOT04_01290 [Candidatus Chaera renei]
MRSHKLRVVRSDSGFTIIELLMAMAFLAFLLIFVVTATVQMMRSYSKGLTIKQMNQSGRSLAEEMIRDVRFASRSSVITSAVAQGRLCLGNAVYVWNPPGSTNGENKFSNGQAVDIARLTDSSGVYCADPTRPIPLSATKVASQQVRVPEMNVNLSADGRLIKFKFVISSNGDSRPVLLDGRWQCPTGPDGYFCAVATFDETVFLRNGGG